jgi:hypothetical protein
MENMSRHGNATKRRCSCREGIAATSVFVAACVHQNTAMAQKTHPRKHLQDVGILRECRRNTLQHFC